MLGKLHDWPHLTLSCELAKKYALESQVFRVNLTEKFLAPHPRCQGGQR